MGTISIIFVIALHVLLIWLSLKDKLHKPPEPQNTRDGVPIDWNILTYAADLVEEEGHSIRGEQNGIGGWSMLNALRWACIYYNHRNDGTYGRCIGYFDMVESQANEGCIMGIMVWEHNNRKDEEVVATLRGMAEKSLVAHRE